MDITTATENTVNIAAQTWGTHPVIITHHNINIIFTFIITFILITKVLLSIVILCNTDCAVNTDSGYVS